MDEFSKAPGTYWYTPGFIGGSLQPGMSEKYTGIYREYEESFEKYVDRFGDEETARYIIDNQEQHWIKNYSRGAYVESGLEGGNALRNKAMRFCETRNWKFETVKGDLSLLEDLISGKWDEERFLVLTPGERSILGGVFDIIKAHGNIAEIVVPRDDFVKRFFYDGIFSEISDDTNRELEQKEDIVIGVDAGGTYTDAVIVSLKQSQVLASGKSPTTYNDLALGIKNALLKLPEILLKKAQRLAISTTLATNAIVEGKGARIGLLLIGYDSDVSGRINIGDGDIKETISGCHNIYGIETELFNEDELLEKAENMSRKGVGAFAVSSYMGTRNPEHEIKAVSSLKEKFSLPVVSGHELTDDIDSVRRAHTVLLNARLLPIINSLVKSVKEVVRELELSADIRLVTTDGSLMNTAEALEQPVRMVLSGPAASVKGVRFLTKLDSCVVADIGGTTTDIAVIEKGSAKRSGRGAVVGKYKTSLHATDIRTLGLGGDSAVKWERTHITIGPERIIPISVLSAEYPSIISKLEKFRGYTTGDYGLVQPGTFFAKAYNPVISQTLNEREQIILEFLSNGPLSIIELSEAMEYPYLSLLGTERLEDLGIIRRSGLTPTDLMVLNNDFVNGDKNSAEIMLGLFAERAGIADNEITDYIWKEIRRMAAVSIITEIVSANGEVNTFPGCEYCRQMFDGNRSLDVKYRLNIPVVGIGAPAKTMLSGLDDFLSAEKVFPVWAEVANAVGAASGAGSFFIDMHIISDESGRFILYSPEGMRIFRKLEEAKTEALFRIKEYALSYALRMEYGIFSLDVAVKDHSAATAFDNDIYIETSIVAKMSY